MSNSQPTQKSIIVKSVRKQLGLTQTGLAGLLSVSPQAVYFWEAGERNPSDRVMMLLWLMTEFDGVLERMILYKNAILMLERGSLSEEDRQLLTHDIKSWLPELNYNREMQGNKR